MTLLSVTMATYMKKILMAELAGSNVLAKATAGRTALRKLLEVTEVEPDEPAPAVLDFKGIDAATSSFLRECVLGYRDGTLRTTVKFLPCHQQRR